MTTIKKPVSRETGAKMFEVGKYKPVIVTINPKTLSFRLKGTKTSYDLPICHCFYMAVLADVERKRYLKQKAKK